MSAGSFEQKDYQEESKEQIIQDSKSELHKLKKQILDNQIFSNTEKHEIQEAITDNDRNIDTQKETELTLNQSPINKELSHLLVDIKQSLIQKNPTKGTSLFHQKWQGESGEQYNQRKQKRIDKYTNKLALETEHHLLTPSKYTISDPHLQEYINNFNSSLQTSAIANDQEVANNPVIANHGSTRTNNYVESPGDNRRNRYTNTAEIGETGYENHSRRTIA